MLRHLPLLSLAALLICSPILADGHPAGYDRHWPQWRGPAGTGVAPHGDPPLEWAEDKNIRWKIQPPGNGSATPIIWGDRLYLLTAINTGRRGEQPADGLAERDDPRDEPGRGGRFGGRGGRGGGFGIVPPTDIYKFAVVAINRKDGSIAWQTVVKEQVPFAGTHNDGTYASGSPITDGRHLYAYFGSYGVYCLDFEGNIKWRRDLGRMRTRNDFGEGASPTLHGDVLVVNWDHEGDSFIVAMNKHDGKELWRKPRDEQTSWATPLAIEVNGKAQVITSGTNRIRGYDLETGDVVWSCDGLTVNVIPSPVYGNGLVYCTSGFRGAALKAIRIADAKGNISGSPAVAWEHNQRTPYVPSPLLYDDALYFFNVNSPVLTCLNAKTGEVNYGPERLEGIRAVYASPVGAAGRVYIAGRSGGAVVLQKGPELKILATNSLDDGFDASPVIVGDEIYLRGTKNLYCIAKD